MSFNNEKIKKNLGIGCIIASSFFLFNPDIAIIDFIPDVFGYILITVGLTQLSETNEKIADAKTCFKKAAICNAVKLGLILVIFGMVSPREMPVSILLFTFVMNMFDLIYVIPGYNYLFGGLMYLGERLDGHFVLGRKKFVPRKPPENMTREQENLFLNKERRRKTRCDRSLSNTERFQRVTVFFVLFKAVTPVLPEFTSLLNHEYNDSFINYYDFIYLFRSLAFILMFVIGVIWLVSAVWYYVGLVRDKRFVQAVKEKYVLEVLPNKALFMKKFVSHKVALFVCATFFLTNLYFDEVNILPNVIAAIIAACSSFAIRKCSSKWKFCFASSVLMGISSITLEVSRFNFNSEFIKEQVMRNPDAYAAWKQMLGVSCAEGACTILVVISFLLLACDIIKKYTGYFIQGTDSFDPERATKELHIELMKPLVVTGIFGVLASLCVPFYFIAMPVRFEAVWFFDLVFSLIFAFCFMENLLNISTNINYTHFAENE